jgi:cytochrome c oxidase assembly protein subunit 15
MPEHRDSAGNDADRLRLARGFAVLSGLTYCLIVVGALVRAHDAGLACPDWPLCHGQVVPEFDLGIAFEWGHRVFAGSISLGLAALTWLATRRRGLRPLLARRLIVAWVVLLTQVVFGGLTVLLKLAPWTVSVHLVLGNLFCLTLLWISFDLRERLGSDASRTALTGATPALAAVVASLLVLQIVLGGWVSSHYAGLACASFPTCDGQDFVPTFSGLVGIQVIHRLNGFLLLIAFATLAVQARGTGRVARLARVGTALVLLQIAVGVTNVLLRLPVWVTGLHTALAAALVLTTGLLVRDVLRARALEPGRSRPQRAVEAR